MVQKMAIMLVLIALFALPKTVSAESVAGQSATLHSPKSSEQRIDSYVDRTIQRAVIREYLETRNSPLVSEVDAFMNACITYDIDCYLLPSIAGLESSFGKHTYPDSHNPFGWGGGYLMFDSLSDSFHAVAKGLKNNYIEKGADTIEKIGPIYAASPTWSVRVQSFHDKFTSLEEEKRQTYEKLAMSL